MSERSAPNAPAHPGQPGWARRIAALVIVVILLAALVEIGSRGIADWISARAIEVMESWSASGEITVGAWQDVLDAYETALWLDGDNPALLQRLGKVYRIRTLAGAGMPPLTRDERVELLRRAQAALERSTKLRPRWPWAFAELAAVKADLGEFDAQYTSALRHAIRLGPWEPQVHWTAAEAGLQGWRQLDHETQTLVLENISRGLASPVHNAAERTLRTLLTLSLNLSLDDLARLGDIALRQPWREANLGLWTRLVVMYWQAWSPDQQTALRDKLIETYRGADEPARRQMLREIASAGKQLWFCPFLPADDLQRSHCRRL